MRSWQGLLAVLTVASVCAIEPGCEEVNEKQAAAQIESAASPTVKQSRTVSIDQLNKIAAGSRYTAGAENIQKFIKDYVNGAADIWKPFLVEANAKPGPYDTKEEIERRVRELHRSVNPKLKEYYEAWEAKAVTVIFLTQGLYQSHDHDNFAYQYDPDSQHVWVSPPALLIPFGYERYTGYSMYTSAHGPKVVFSCEPPFKSGEARYDHWAFWADGALDFHLPLERAKHLDIATANHYFEYTFLFGYIKANVNGYDSTFFPSISMSSARYIVVSNAVNESDTLLYLGLGQSRLPKLDNLTLWPRRDRDRSS